MWTRREERQHPAKNVLASPLSILSRSFYWLLGPEPLLPTLGPIPPLILQEFKTFIGAFPPRYTQVLLTSRKHTENFPPKPGGFCHSGHRWVFAEVWRRVARETSTKRSLIVKAVLPAYQGEARIPKPGVSHQCIKIDLVGLRFRVCSRHTPRSAMVLLACDRRLGSSTTPVTASVVFRQYEQNKPQTHITRMFIAARPPFLCSPRSARAQRVKLTVEVAEKRLRAQQRA